MTKQTNKWKPFFGVSNSLWTTNSAVFCHHNADSQVSVHCCNKKVSEWRENSDLGCIEGSWCDLEVSDPLKKIFNNNYIERPKWVDKRSYCWPPDSSEHRWKIIRLDLHYNLNNSHVSTEILIMKFSHFVSIIYTRWYATAAQLCPRVRQ